MASHVYSVYSLRPKVWSQIVQWSHHGRSQLYNFPMLVLLMPLFLRFAPSDQCRNSERTWDLNVIQSSRMTMHSYAARRKTLLVSLISPSPVGWQQKGVLWSQEKLLRKMLDVQFISWPKLDCVYFHVLWYDWYDMQALFPSPKEHGGLLSLLTMIVS